MNPRIRASQSLAVLVLGLSLGCGSHAREETGSSTASIVLGTPATDHPEAVLVDLYQGGVLEAYCSGTVIAPYVVLTAGHCVDGYDGWQVTAPGASTQIAASSNGVMLDWAGNGDTLTPQAHDVALVILASPIALPSYPTLATTPVPDGTPVTNVGRVQDGTLSMSGLYESIPLEVFDATSRGWPFDYVTMDAIQSGDSGGPDFWASPSGPVLVAVNSGATKNNNYEVLARIDLVEPWLEAQIAAYPNGLPLATPDAGTDAPADGGPAQD